MDQSTPVKTLVNQIPFEVGRQVSSKTTSNPARFNPACSHCDNGLASSPIRFTAEIGPDLV